MNKKKILDYLVLTAFFIFSFIITIKHELWYDEAQSYLIATKLSCIDIIKFMKYEGHSCLFYFILKLTKIIGIKYESINILSWLTSSIASLLLIQYTDIKRPIKYSILFSYPILYHCTVFARPYALSYLFVVLLMIMYKKRYKHYIVFSFILFILSNTHLLMCILVGTILLNEIYELIKYKNYKKERITIIITILIAFILFFLQIIGSLFVGYSNYSLKKPFKIIMLNLFTLLFEYFKLTTNNNILTILSMIIYILLIIKSFKVDKKSFYFYITTFILTYLFFTIAYQYLENKSQFIYLPIIFIYYISKKNKFTDLYVLLLLLLTIPFSIKTCLLDYEKEYTSDYDIANYIINEKESANIGAYFEMSGINVYLDENYISYNLLNDEPFTYHVYKDVIPNNETLEEKIKKLDLDYIVYPKTKTYKKDEIENLINQNKIELVLDNNNTIFNNHNILYKIKK